MDAPQFLADDDFAHTVRYAPLVSIDLIIRDLEGNVLLGLRNNEPAKDTYFVPGGVIRKNETMREAFTRILNAETGLTASFDEATLVGAFEHFYKTNRFGHPDYGTHYVVLAYEVSLKTQQAVAIDLQHSDLQWMSKDEITSATNVHPNTKAYFREAASVGGIVIFTVVIIGCVALASVVRCQGRGLASSSAGGVSAAQKAPDLGTEPDQGHALRRRFRGRGGAPGECQISLFRRQRFQLGGKKRGMRRR